MLIINSPNRNHNDFIIVIITTATQMKIHSTCWSQRQTEEETKKSKCNNICNFVKKKIFSEPKNDFWFVDGMEISFKRWQSQHNISKKGFWSYLSYWIWIISNEWLITLMNMQLS